MKKLQKIMTDLLEKQLSESLTNVHAALGKWDTGEFGTFEAHAEVLRHAARAETLASRMSQVDPEHASSILRDAYDAGILSDTEFVRMVGKMPTEVDPSPPVSEHSAGAGKREFIEELLSKGPVLVHIDGRHVDADVPPQFAQDSELVLRFGYSLTPAIIDLCIDDDALSGTLTFGGVPRRCILGWSAVYAMVSEADQQGRVWPEDVPFGVLDAWQKDEGSKAKPQSDTDIPAPVPIKPAKRGSHLTLVK